MRQVTVGLRGAVALVDDGLCFSIIRCLAWSLTGGYAVHNRWWNGRYHAIPMHRLVIGAVPGEEVDHINGNRLDNRIANLRLCTRRENCRNRKTRGPSGFRGVSARGDKWIAGIHAGPRLPDGRATRVHLGTFANVEDAARAYDKAARKYFGAFASTNFNDQEEQ